MSGKIYYINFLVIIPNIIDIFLMSYFYLFQICTILFFISVFVYKICSKIYPFYGMLYKYIIIYYQI